MGLEGSGCLCYAIPQNACAQPFHLISDFWGAQGALVEAMASLAALGGACLAGIGCGAGVVKLKATAVAPLGGRHMI